MVVGIINELLVASVRAVEWAFPGPETLGVELDEQRKRRARRGDPVVLIGGFANSPASWDVFRRSLERDGFTVEVAPLSGYGLADVRQAAAEVAAVVEKVRRETGARRVDLVGFSEGGLIARQYVAALDGAGSVDQVLSIGTPHRGVVGGIVGTALSAAAMLGLAPRSTPQLMHDNEFLRELDASDHALRTAGPVRYVSVYSFGHDGMVAPWNAALEGALMVAIRERGGKAPSHLDLYRRSNRAYEAVRELLLR